jgi:peptidoglycan/LPS O-acetylase OafA/YrhL
VFGSLVLAPPTAYMIYFSRHSPMSLATFWRTDFWGKAYQQSVYWYLGVLFLLFALTASAFALSRRFATWKPATAPPARWLFPAFVLGLTAATTLLSRWWTVDTWSHNYVLVYQPTRFPLYIGYFALGLCAGRRHWFTRRGYRPSLGLWLTLCAASGLAYLGWRFTAPPALAALQARMITALLFNLFCLASLLAGIALFLDHAGQAGPVARSLARHSYGVYYLHPLVMYPLAWLLLGAPGSSYAKATALVLFAYLACWGLSAALLTRLPGLRRMF